LFFYDRNCGNITSYLSVGFSNSTSIVCYSSD